MWILLHKNTDIPFKMSTEGVKSSKNHVNVVFGWPIIHALVLQVHFQYVC